MRSAVLALMLVLTGCPREEIVVASRPAEEDGGLARSPQRCVTNEDCSADEYCSKRTCTDVAGTCDLRPILCPSDADPICGCDGMSYFNDCLRRAAGAVPDASRPCSTTARRCSNDAPCPANAHCARLLASASECSAFDGMCWVVPAECPPSSGDRWVACEPLDGTACIDTCQAIQRGIPSVRAWRCP